MRGFAGALALLVTLRSVSMVSAEGTYRRPEKFEVPTILYVVGGTLWTLVFLGCFCCIRVLRDEWRECQQRLSKKDS